MKFMNNFMYVKDRIISQSRCWAHPIEIKGQRSVSAGCRGCWWRHLATSRTHTQHTDRDLGSVCRRHAMSGEDQHVQPPCCHLSHLTRPHLRKSCDVSNLCCGQWKGKHYLIIYFSETPSLFFLLFLFLFQFSAHSLLSSLSLWR